MREGNASLILMPSGGISILVTARAHWCRLFCRGVKAASHTVLHSVKLVICFTLVSFQFFKSLSWENSSIRDDDAKGWKELET